ncbi:hypothetical protein GH714_026203 [Hevea brasiliensis]|uniref:Uncharacterized protein n=1 Tax=Hevea brasiliensis TaxID=3981 RepID=A0A6A6K828_HEVBR|nr:hypothetical protein GH714_026203 [Hevea brasiliensis]
MVSLRRRKLLGLCAGRSSFLTPLPRFFDNGIAPLSSTQNARSVSVHPLPADDVKQPGEKTVSKVGAGSSNVSASSSSKEQQSQPYPEENGCGTIMKMIKIYVKMVELVTTISMIHFQIKVMSSFHNNPNEWGLGKLVLQSKVGNQLNAESDTEKACSKPGTMPNERAAFMCGREPNFELSEEEKQELRKFKWDEFLAITRSAINSKKHKRRNGSGLQKRSEPALQNGDWDDKQGVNSFSASEDTEPDSST